MRALALTVSALFLLAGCISGGDPVESADVQVADAAATGEAPASAAPAAPAENATEPAAPTRSPVAYEGRTATSACVPTGPMGCEPVRPAGDPENTFVEIPSKGVPTAFEGTLTWSAATPATAEMYAMLFAVRSCGMGCMEMDDGMFFMGVSGMSPLAIQAPDIAMGENETLILHVGIVRPTPPLPVPFFYSVEQAFAVEGMLTAVVASAR